MRTSTLALFLTASALVGCGNGNDQNMNDKLLELARTQQEAISLQQKEIDLLSAKVEDLTKATGSNTSSIGSLMSVARDHTASIRILAERR